MRNRTISSNPVNEFFKKVFLAEKLNNRTGFLLVVLIASALAYIVSTNILLGTIVFACIVGISLLTTCFVNPEIGLYITTFYGFSASALNRFLFHDQLPVGTGIDILVFTMFLGLFLSKKDLRTNTRNFFKNPVVICYSILIMYLTAELVNPLGHSFMGWFQVMRKVFESFLVVFISFNVFDNLKKIILFINILFLPVVVVALYGCFQQWHGLLPTELDWVNADPVRFGLICLWGVYRKFSLLGGPTEFGVVMAGSSLLYALIGLNRRKTISKALFIGGSIFMILGMTYSGTRTANAMLAGGIAFYLLLTINKTSSKLFAGFTILAFLVVLYAPIYGSYTLNRFRSTFSATKDASYNVRETNRKTIQPFIWKHPFGGGLSTTGVMGEKYNPTNPNAGFPSDSSYLNKALESGWIGMLLTLLVYFFVLQQSVRGYFVADNKETKMLFAACSAFFFSYFLGEIAQEAVGVFANMMLFFPVLGFVLRLRQVLDRS